MSLLVILDCETMRLVTVASDLDDVQVKLVGFLAIPESNMAPFVLAGNVRLSSEIAAILKSPGASTRLCSE